MAERLKLYYPVKPYRVNQRFGANEACVRDFGGPNQRVVDKVHGVCPAGYDELYQIAHGGLGAGTITWSAKPIC